MSSLLLPQGFCFSQGVGGCPCVLRKAIHYLNCFSFGSFHDMAPCLRATIYLAGSPRHLTPLRHLGGSQFALGLVVPRDWGDRAGIQTERGWISLGCLG